jgi:hypothetical protein
MVDKSMEEFQHYIRGVDFPAGRDEVASTAEDNGAPENVVRQIRNANRERFDDPQQVYQAVRGSL